MNIEPDLDLDWTRLLSVSIPTSCVGPDQPVICLVVFGLKVGSQLLPFGSTLAWVDIGMGRRRHRSEGF